MWLHGLWNPYIGSSLDFTTEPTLVYVVLWCFEYVVFCYICVFLLLLNLA